MPTNLHESNYPDSVSSSAQAQPLNYTFSHVPQPGLSLNPLSKPTTATNLKDRTKLNEARYIKL